MLPAAERLLEAAIKRHKDKQLQSLTNRLAEQLRTAFKKQQGAFLSKLEVIAPDLPASEARPGRRWGYAQNPQDIVDYYGALREANVPDWESAFDAAALDTLDAFSEPLQEYIQLAMLYGGRQALAAGDFAASFELPFPQAAEYASQHAADLVSGINATTTDEVRRLVTKAVDEGQSYTELAKALREKYSQFHTPQPQQHIKDRAELIAVTEIGDAYEAGNEQIGQQLQGAGLEMQKAWLTVEDSGVDDKCFQNEQAGWIPFDQEFPSGHMRPLAHPACRCTLLMRRKPDEEAAA